MSQPFLADKYDRVRLEMQLGRKLRWSEASGVDTYRKPTRKRRKGR